MLDLEETVDTIREGIETIGSLFEDPQADWQPAFFALAEDQFVPMVYDGPEFDEPHKDAFSWASAELVRQLRAEAAVFVASIWMVVLEEPASRAAKDQIEAFEREHGRRPRTYEEQGQTRPADDPSRVEAVLLTVIEPDRVRMSWAEIKRSKNAPPQLGEWQHLSDDAEVEGRFTTPVQEQLRLNREGK
jgi:hypothetical protein